MSFAVPWGLWALWGQASAGSHPSLHPCCPQHIVGPKEMLVKCRGGDASLLALEEFFSQVRLPGPATYKWCSWNLSRKVPPPKPLHQHCLLRPVSHYSGEYNQELFELLFPPRTQEALVIRRHNWSSAEGNIASDSALDRQSPQRPGAGTDAHTVCFLTRECPKCSEPKLLSSQKPKCSVHST